ncbi:amine oxidase B [Xylona heveae TC161]|uniref:Amine oxidase n=1 Tax=Xylona heveae (strain CBS 132557 / TC161) TaxID=1328760 RepID=A0A165A748_XYLHT|nr:amine oxidase B [Xylona heveae TC161]KZF20049.1 amine oxidase B [Xylona heveae TC161]
MYDVLVIGAGLSGLQAALTAQQAGLSVVVVEARDRVGGKTWSVPLASGRGCVELGAAWTNDTNQRRIWAYVQKFGLKMFQQPIGGDCVMYENSTTKHKFPFGTTPKFSTEETKDLERLRDAIAAKTLTASGDPEDDKITLEEFGKKLGATQKTLDMINLWARVMLGVEHSELSAEYFFDYCRRGGGFYQMRSDAKDGAQYLRFQDGSQSVSKGIASLIGHANIQLSTPVASVEDRGSYVITTSTDGKRFRSKKVVLSVPSTLYKDITFSPALPGPKRRVTDTTILGDYSKTIVCYDRPWWRDLGFNGMCLSYEGPIIVGRDTSVDDKGQYSFTFFCNGGPSREWTKLPPHERRAKVLQHLAAMFDNHPEVYKPIEVFEQEWQKEQYSKGAVCPVTEVGLLSELNAEYRAPAGNLHFVGTEYAAEWKGYMEGAVCSGEDGGKEVVEALRADKKLQARL